jgi:hypothetical protein
MSQENVEIVRQRIETPSLRFSIGAFLTHASATTRPAPPPAKQENVETQPRE